MPEATQSQIRAEQLVAKLLADSKVGSVVRQTAKALFAEDPPEFPEDRVEPLIAPLSEEAKALREELAALKAEREAEKKAAEEAAAAAKLQDGIADARRQFNLTDEGYEKMLERMRTTGNYTDPAAAAAFVAQAEPKPAPKNTYAASTLDSIFNPGETDETAEWFKNADQALDKHFHMAFSDPDRYVRETFGNA